MWPEGNELLDREEGVVRVVLGVETTLYDPPPPFLGMPFPKRQLVFS